MLEFIAWIFGFRRCPCCERYSRHTKRRRLNTAYVNDKQNFLKSCRVC